MIKTLDEAITFYKKKYKLLENYDIEKAEEYKQLADWLIDYKRLKIILNESVAKMNKIINDYKSKMEETIIGEIIKTIVCITLLGVCVSYLVLESYNPFIYFNF